MRQRLKASELRSTISPDLAKGQRGAKPYAMPSQLLARMNMSLESFCGPSLQKFPEYGYGVCLLPMLSELQRCHSRRRALIAPHWPADSAQLAFAYGMETFMHRA